jgi:hypothetical protein
MTVQERNLNVILWICAGASFGLGIALLANAIWEAV